MCGGGGGDGGAGARKRTEDARVASATDAINLIFGKGSGTPLYEATTQKNGRRTVASQVLKGYDTAQRDANAAAREALYSQIGKDQEEKLIDDLDTDRSDTERAVKFAMARSGLAGGSADIDANTDVLEQYNKGLLSARNKSTATVNNARSADEKTRVNLINNIRAGLDEGSAISAANESLANSAKAAADEAAAETLSGFFESLGAAKQAKAKNDAALAAVQALSGGGSSAGSTAGSSYSGRTSSTGR